MFNNKDHDEDYSSDELELMKMIKEYEQDEAQVKDQGGFESEAKVEKPGEADSALDSQGDHTKVMSRRSLEEDKTLSIMPVSSHVKDEAVEQTMDIPKQVQDEVVEEDDDPRFELKHKKDKKPKKDKKKKDKKEVSEDERLNKIIIVLMVIAGIVVVLAGGYLIYNSFFRDSGSSDDKTEEITTTTDKDKDKTNNSTKPDKDTTVKPQETPQKEDHSAEIKALQALIEQETTNANNYTKLADDEQTALNKYNASKTALEAEVSKAQAVVDNAGDEATEEDKVNLKAAQKYLDDFLAKNKMPSQQVIDENRSKASACFTKIENYRNQIAAFQQ